MRRAGAALVTLVLLLVVPTTLATARPAQAASPSIRLLGQPVAVAPDGDFSVLLAVDAPEAVDIAVDIYDRAGPDDPIGPVPDEGATATFPPVALPSADAADDGPRPVAFTIELYQPGEANPDPAWGWPLDEPGVYPVRVRLRGPDEETLAVLMTAVVRLPGPDQRVTPTEVAVLVDAHRPPPLDPDERADEGSADPDLVAQLPPVLAALDERPSLPATFSLTPDAVARLAGDEAATDVLADLRAVLAVERRDVLDAPYVDIDPTSLVDADLADELTAQRDLGRRTLDSVLEEPLTGTWRLPTPVDGPTLDQLHQRGVFRAVVGGGVLEDGAGTLSPVELTAGPSTVRASATAGGFVLGAASGDPVLAAHRLLARLAAAATGREQSARVIVDVDPALADPESLQVAFDALTLGTDLYRATTLDALLDAPATVGATLAGHPAVALGTYPDELRAARADEASYTSMVGDRADLLRPIERALALSAAAELPLEDRRAEVDGVRRDLADTFSSIDLPESDTVTLGAQEGTFPLPISSSLDEPVQVVIQLEASDRLELPDDRIEATLDSERTVVDVQVQARATGDTPVRITVRSPDDGVVLAESRYVVRSTAVSEVGILLTVGAAGFLAVWWGRHWLRTRRARSAPGV
ncbi:MAG: hypothetical protein KDB04_18960 [Acidimicrobiales bacterium]|nr:hypothetical protein [Acidimicrobiales bacterium]HRW36349.1 DUF6049 family protein [Aquihabitans sp.]